MSLTEDRHRIERRADGEAIRHDRLTDLEALLLRVLFTIGCTWEAISVAGLLAHLEEDREIEGAELELLEQLLEEEKANRS